MRSLTKAFTIPLKAVPITTATARSITFPRKIKSLKPFIIVFPCFIIAGVITCDDQIVAESENYALTNKNFTEHAEVEAMLQATKKLGTTDLSKCTLYTTMEPCTMCALLIREYRLKRVVFSLGSPDMGGYSKYPILIDTNLNEKYPQHFGDVPEITAGMLKDRAMDVWKKRHDLKKSGEKHKLDKY